MIKRLTVLLTACVLVAGCTRTAERTIARGIEYGMTPEQVIAHLEPAQQMISRDDTTIVTEGYDSTWGMKRRNTFVFQNGKLAAHQNTNAGN